MRDSLALTTSRPDTLSFSSSSLSFVYSYVFVLFVVLDTFSAVTLTVSSQCGIFWIF